MASDDLEPVELLVTVAARERSPLDLPLVCSVVTFVLLCLTLYTLWQL